MRRNNKNAHHIAAKQFHESIFKDFIKYNLDCSSCEMGINIDLLPAIN